MFIIDCSSNHSGVRREIQILAEALKFLKVTHRCCGCNLTYRGYAMTEHLSRQAWNLYGEQYCYEYDFIIVTDTIPISRPFLLMNCPTRIILRVTNRFDHKLEGDHSWYRLMNDIKPKKKYSCGTK